MWEMLPYAWKRSYSIYSFNRKRVVFTDGNVAVLNYSDQMRASTGFIFLGKFYHILCFLHHTSIFMPARGKLLHVRYSVRGENGKRWYNKNTENTKSQVEARFQGDVGSSRSQIKQG